MIINQIGLPQQFLMQFSCRLLLVTVLPLTQAIKYKAPLSMKRYKIWKMGSFAVVKGHSRSLKIAAFDRAHTSSY